MKPKLVMGLSQAGPRPELHKTLLSLIFYFTAQELKNTEPLILTTK
jgi:hypothetical protein